MTARLFRPGILQSLAKNRPEVRRRPVELVFEGRPGVVITAPLSVREAGFSLHAATRRSRGREGAGSPPA